MFIAIITAKLSYILRRNMHYKSFIEITVADVLLWKIFQPLEHYCRTLLALALGDRDTHLDDTSIVGVTILFGTAIPVNIAILQRYLRNDLHHFYQSEHGNSCNLSVFSIFAARSRYASAILRIMILSVRPSVRKSSHACFVKKGKNIQLTFLHHMKR